MPLVSQKFQDVQGIYFLGLSVSHVTIVCEDIVISLNHAPTPAKKPLPVAIRKCFSAINAEALLAYALL